MRILSKAINVRPRIHACMKDHRWAQDGPRTTPSAQKKEPARTAYFKMGPKPTHDSLI